MYASSRVLVWVCICFIFYNLYRNFVTLLPSAVFPLQFTGFLAETIRGTHRVTGPARYLLASLRSGNKERRRQLSSFLVTNSSGDIRTISENGTVLFCGATSLAPSATPTEQGLTDHCKSDLTKRYPIIDTLGRSQEAIFIPESDLYRLVFRSKLPSAERFTDWVTTEVLPSIWKNGGYIAQQETLSPEELMVNGCNMTVHRDYANKACPGQYLYDRHGAIAAAVNELLGSGTTQPPEAAPGAVQGFPATPFTVRVIIPDLNYRKGPGMSYAVRGQTARASLPSPRCRTAGAS